MFLWQQSLETVPEASRYTIYKEINLTINATIHYNNLVWCEMKQLFNAKIDLIQLLPAQTYMYVFFAKHLKKTKVNFHLPRFLFST